MQSLEDIHLIAINDSAVDLIEHVHQDVGMEQEGIKHKAVGWSVSFDRS